MKIPNGFRILLYAGLTLVAAQRVSGQELGVELDPSESNVQFRLAATLHTVHGKFKVKNGSIRCDMHTGKAGGQIVVDVKSAVTGVAERDRQMHANILESDRFPEALFLPERVTGPISSEGEFQVQVHGVLRIHGQDHEISFPARIKLKNGRFAANAHFIMPYVSWGMKDPSTFILRVSDKVDLDINAVGKIR